MRIHNDLKIQKLKQMRKEGRSILYLMKLFSLPKTTVWYHVRSVTLTKRQKDFLRAQQGGGAKHKETRWLQAKEKARELLASENRELSIIIAMLYWAEGHKKQSCGFTNSDGRMIALYLYILRSMLLIHNDSILTVVRIFSGMNRSKCLSYWSDITQIPKSEIVVRLNDGGTSGRTSYGICHIVVRKGGQTLKLFHSLINQIFTEVVR